MSRLAVKRRVLVVGEGRETEYNYFVGFRNAHEELLSRSATSISVRRGHGGDAIGIVRHAIQEAKRFAPNKNHDDRVYLLLDAEGPGTVPGRGRTPELPAAERLATRNGIEIVYSCPPFEYWLLCHFPKASRGEFADCAAVITALNQRWGEVSRVPYDKADPEVFTRLATGLESARAQALDIDLHHVTVRGDARRVNPSTQVYELVARLIGVRSGCRCPVTGGWTLLDNPAVRVRRTKGDPMPMHANGECHWVLTNDETGTAR